MKDKRVLLIIGGGIAAYKALELIRRLKERGVHVRAILTDGGARFITPLSVASLSGAPVFQDLFSLKDESEMGHIRLSREADLVLIAPATADLMAKMAQGLANDLASTALLATTAPVMAAPAMNVEMWAHPATQRNVKQLRADGVRFVGPASGDMACGEVGAGRLAEAPDIVAAVEAFFAGGPKPLQGRRALVTAGPTIEPIDPVRYIANRSSGRQGYAVAEALAALGAETILVSGPTALGAPPLVERVMVETARQMDAACQAALPADIAVCVAAVADWRAAEDSAQKIKKNGARAPVLNLTENPDILAGLSAPSNRRPALVVGFAAETENLRAHAEAKRAKKGCDWIVANDVSLGSDVMGGPDNRVELITAQGHESWPRLSKAEVAARLAQKIADHFAQQS